MCDFTPQEAKIRVCEGSIESFDFTNLSSIALFLRETPYASKEIQRINSGWTNFVYRLFLEIPYGPEQKRTAILKYYASYQAGEPHVILSADRQSYEARALKIVPWRQFNDKDEKSAERIAPSVTAPDLFSEEGSYRINIIEDVDPVSDTHSKVSKASKGPTLTARIFLEEASTSPSKYALAGAVGMKLGTFLGQLHNWGKEQQRTDTDIQAFAANMVSKELRIESQLKDLLSNITEIGYPITASLQSRLLSTVDDLERDVRANEETLIMGDFWPGNVLLSVCENNKLQGITLIDWEFAALGPEYIDFGHFLSEAILLGYFEGNDTSYVPLAEAFIQHYIDIVKDLDLNRALSFIGTHIIMVLPKRIRHPDSKATRDEAIPCLEQAIELIANQSQRRSKAQQLNALNGILGFMRGKGDAIG